MPDALRALERPDYALDIAPYSFEVSPGHTIRTIAYNQQVPGPLLRFKEGQSVTVEINNRSNNPEIVHWHGLFLPSEIDGAMEEGTPHIPPGGQVRYTLTPRPAGFRWYHTHTFAGHDLKKGSYTGQHGFLYVEPRDNPGRYDQEVFLALQDWDGALLGSEDGAMDPVYRFSTINGRALGFNEPLRVKTGQRLLLHILNSSATDPHWIAFAGHQFQVIALDGNPCPQPQVVSMLRLSPAERVSAIVEMNHPGVWILGEIRKHAMAAGMGLVIEYSDQKGKPLWQQPDRLTWDYRLFGSLTAPPIPTPDTIEIPLIFDSRFKGHGAMDQWTINGKSFPEGDAVPLTHGRRYRLVLKNHSAEDHPVHLHRHSFELRRIANLSTHGIRKDTVLVPAREQVEVEFNADNPGSTLFHCHQQNHMDLGFMMLFRYA